MQNDIVETARLAHETQNYRIDNGMDARLSYYEAALELGAPADVAHEWDTLLRRARRVWDLSQSEVEKWAGYYARQSLVELYRSASR